MNDGQVSIIMPVYNTERYLADAIGSVLAQTYHNWELIAVDDGSTDSSCAILNQYKALDHRIRPVYLTINQGAAQARNVGIGMANGRYLCFLDSDDIWNNRKLEIQIGYMQKTGEAFTFTSYCLIDEDGSPLGKAVHAPRMITSREALYKTAISTITVCMDLCKVKCPDMPQMDGAEDTATWLKVLRQAGYAAGIDSILASYRQVPGSMSHNLKARFTRMWRMYRKVEGMPVWRSVLYYCRWAWYVLGKRKVYEGTE